MDLKRKEQLKKIYKEKIEYLENAIEHVQNGDDKIMLRSILDDIRYHSRIVTNEFFQLNDKETERAHEFYEKHIKGRYFGTIGGGTTYHITPTGLGNIVHISTHDEKGNLIEEDITDSSHW